VEAIKMKVNKKTVSDICNLIVKEATTIKANETISMLFQKMIEDQRTRHVYVVDNENILIGSVRLNDLVDLILPYLQNLDDEMFNKFATSISDKLVSDIMIKDFLYLTEDTKLSNMISVMLEHRVNELPIVDEKKRISGEVNFLEFIKFMSDNKPFKDSQSNDKE